MHFKKEQTWIVEYNSEGYMRHGGECWLTMAVTWLVAVS